MIKMIKISSIFIILFTTSCARNINSDTYTSSSLTGTVAQGTVISVRNVQVREKDSLQQNTYGGLAGGALLGTAGSMVGGGKATTLAAIASGIAGAVLGAEVEDRLSTTNGIEYVVKLDGKNQIDNRIYNDNYSNNYYKINNLLGLGSHNYRNGHYNNNYRNNNYRNNFNGDTIFVIQKDNIPLNINQRVFIIYEKGKARIIAKS